MLVSTARLDLVALSPEVVAALVAGDAAAAARLAPVPVDDSTFAGDEYVLGLRHAQLQADPASGTWLLHAMVERDRGRVVGRIGFHAPPDEDGTVEVGYVVQPAERRRGYALEAVVGLLDEAVRLGARRCLASVSPGNAASQSLVARLGFVKVGEQVDEVDGLEEVLAVDLPLSR